MENVKVFICAHKEVALPRHPYFLPIQAGAALHEPIAGYQPDSDGDNISRKNPHFCELTCHYWAWKNLRGVDIVGLNHYRRYFDFQQRWPQMASDKRFVSVEDFLSRPYAFPDLEQTLRTCDIILPTARHWQTSNSEQYADYHIKQDWETLRSIVAERSPDYVQAFTETMDHSNRAAGYNMFITRWPLFEKYSAWLFDLLFEVERRVPPAADPVQSRIYGYMSERLINVFCARHHLRVRHVPLVMPLDDYRPGLNVSPLQATWRRLVNDVQFRVHS